VKTIINLLRLAFVVILLIATKSFSQDILDIQKLPEYLHHRATRIPMSIFGTYDRDGELLVYPFYEYYYDSNIEYEPFDFGLPSNKSLGGNIRHTSF